MNLMKFEELLQKVNNCESLSKDEIKYLLAFSPDSSETYSVMCLANQISKEVSDGKAEIHAQLALDRSPCTCNCMFCSFSSVNNLIIEQIFMNVDTAVDNAKQFETDGANAVYIMTTGTYPIDKFIEISKEIRRNLKPDTKMIANVGDQSLKNAIKIKDAGYSGVYHVVRLREGIDTDIAVDVRKNSIENFKEAGLLVGTCVEPIGPEHTCEELADIIAYTSSIKPAFSGAMRRIAIPGTKIAERGMISDLRLAQIAAVTRLGVSRNVKGNCFHEPSPLGVIAGANLFWAEVGANPRHTEMNSGRTVDACRNIFMQSGWEYYSGSSRIF